MKKLILGLLLSIPFTAMAAQYECYYDYNRTEVPAVTIRNINLVVNQNDVVLIIKEDGFSYSAVAKKSSKSNTYQVAEKDTKGITYGTALYLRNIEVRSPSENAKTLTAALKFDLGRGSQLESNYYSCNKI